MSLSLSPHRLIAILSLIVLSVVGMPSGAMAQESGQDQPVGFGSQATGGTDPFVVTSLASDGPGSLADAVSAPGRLVTFGISGTIHLPNRLELPRDTTITGAGAEIVITGRPLVVDGVSNVVIRWLTRRDTIGSNDDGVQVFNGATDVWLDHLSFTNIHDESIEVSQGATDVTISWVHIFQQNRGVLVGNMPDHSNGDNPSHVTIHNSWFDDVAQRQPRVVRWANLHAFNNVIEGWTRTAMSAAQRGELLSEANVLVRGAKGAGLLTRADQGGKNPLPGLARSVGDLTMGGSVRMEELEPLAVFTPPYDYPLERASPEMADAVRAGAGAAMSASMSPAPRTSTDEQVDDWVDEWTGELLADTPSEASYYGRRG